MKIVASITCATAITCYDVLTGRDNALINKKETTMTAILFVRNAAGETIDRHETAFVRTVDLIARALAFQYPDCEIVTEFGAA